MQHRDLRTVFDEDPELYDRARPGYPAELYDDLFALGGLHDGSRVLEIGPGTGQATCELVARGTHVVAVELGGALAALLRRRLAPASVEVVHAGFEGWSAGPDVFDAVLAFTAWHWLDPAVRTARAAATLRPGGVLATVTTGHVAGGSSELFAALQGCYERWDPATPPGLRLTPAEELPPTRDEVDGSELFGPGERRRYQQDVAYSTRGYLEVLGTYSGHRALPAEQREQLLGCIATLVDGAGGSITKRYLYELRLARRRR